MKNAEWQDFDQLIFDLSDMHDHETNNVKARIVLRTLRYLYHQHYIMEVLRSKIETLEARQRAS